MKLIATASTINNDNKNNTVINSAMKSDILFSNLNEQNCEKNEADENNNLHMTTTTTTTTTTFLKSHHHHHYLDGLVDKLNKIDVANNAQTSTLPTSPSQKTLVNSSSSSTSSSSTCNDQSMSESSSRSNSRNQSQCSFHHAQSSSTSSSSSSSSSSSGCSSSLSGSSINSDNCDNCSLSRSQPIQTPTYSTITSLKGHPLYKMQDKIRSGGFGDVYKGTRKYDQLPIAIKIISKKKISSWTMVSFIDLIFNKSIFMGILLIYI